MPKLNPDDSLIGAQLGDYVLTRVLATGGMARVYEGVDHRLKRHAAVKVLDDDNLSTDVTLRQRFQREARAIAQLEHPNIITIYQYGEQDGVYFLAMKLIRGNDLGHELSHLRQAGERMDVARTLMILEQIAAALDVAHAANIVHRDIKPSNILLDQSERAILTDFGLVFQPSVDTTSGASFGTPRYIAPEQAMSSSNALPQSDLYSLGVIAYQMLVGQTPFAGESPLELALAHISTPPPPPRSIDPDIPEAAERELLKALEKDPDKRHATATEFVSALKHAYGVSGAESVALAISPPRMPQVAHEHHPRPEYDEELVPTSILPAPPVPLPQKRRTIPFLPVAAVVVLAVVMGGILLLTERDFESAGQMPPSETEQIESAMRIGVTATPSRPIAPTEAPSVPVPVSSDVEVVPIRLVYSETVFAIVNGNEFDLSTNTLRFERDQEHYSGEAIVRQKVPAGSCFRLQMQGRQNPLPSGCGQLDAEILLPDPLRFFWRTMPESSDTFDVYYEGRLIATCPTVERGSERECLLTLTAPPAG